MDYDNTTQGTKQAKLKRRYSDPYTEDLLKRLHDHLSNITTTIKTDSGECILVNKYNYRSSEYLKNVYAGEPALPYVIDFCDLTEKAFLYELLNAGADYVLAREVQKLLKNASPKLYNMIRENTRCRLDDCLIR
jgi:hypothetical protein